MRFEELNIPEQVLEGIREAGFTACTPVQEAALPIALQGGDIAAQAQTGTGKTAVFLITVFSRMLAMKGPGRGSSPRVLIIAPTRELVTQIRKEAELLGSKTGFRIVAVFGGIDYEKQKNELAGGADIVVGTPGRLIDYLKQRVYSLKKTQFLVIDEADRLFDMGFISDLRFILRRMSPYDRRQSMLFSATLSHRVMELCYEHMNNPERISITPEQVTVDRITQELYHVGSHEKMGFLFGVLKREGVGRTIIFANTKATAEKLGSVLEVNKIKAAAITGDLPQKKRLSILSRFQKGEIQVLVATDVASRGLHIEGVTHVINYDIPQDAEDYVHRIGRTARAGAEGKAISFACEDFVYNLEAVEHFIGQTIPVFPVDESLIETGLRRGRLSSSRQGARRERRAGGRESGARPPRRDGKKKTGRPSRSGSGGRSR